MLPARPRRVLAIVLAMLIGAPVAAAEAQVWKPRSRTGAKAKTSTKKTRRASRTTVKRAKATNAKPTQPKKKKARAKRRVRDDGDFTILEEDYPIAD